MNYAESIEQQSPITAFTSDTFSAVLMKQFNPRTEQTQTAIDGAVRTLALQALENAVVISNDAYQTIQAIIAEIDRKLSQQINTIIHDEAFQQLESSWRGLHYLVNNTETDELLKIRCMPVTKTELRRVLKRYKGVAWDQSPIFKKVYEEEYGQFGGEPLGCLVGSSGPRELPPQALTDPYVNLSIHTAPLVRRSAKQKSQCANNCGRLSRHRLSHAQDRRLCPLSRLYLFRAHPPSRKSIRTRNRFSGAG
jgi:type VI secretion system protein ImpC